MIPGLEMLACQDLAVPIDVMQHVVNVESSFNPYAIGVVGARLARQPRSLEEAVATAEKLEREGFNFSLGLAQVNRHNLAAQGLDDYEQAFSVCPNLAAGARILADCRIRADGDWDKALSCYYSGNFERGFRDGYVQKVRASMRAAGEDAYPSAPAIPVQATAAPEPAVPQAASLRERRGRSPMRAVAGLSEGNVVTGEQVGTGRTAPAAMPWGEGPYVPRVTGPARSAVPAQAPPSGPQHSSRDHGQPDSAFVF